MTQSIQSVRWDSQYSQIAFGAQSSQLNIDQIRLKIGETFQRKQESQIFTDYFKRIKKFLNLDQSEPILFS